MLAMQTIHKIDEPIADGVLTTFQSAIFVEIAKYKAKRKKVPADRTDLINQIKLIITEDSVGLEQIKSDIRDALNHMRTGWWIFKTGRSKLKRNILRVVNDRVFEHDGIAAEMVLFQPAPLRIQDDIAIESPSEASCSIDDEHAESERLRLALSKSQRELHYLQSQLQTFAEENEALREEILALRRRLGISHGVSQHSPSADVTGSFSAFEM